ncbi:hypothetical protein llap_18892 [Limosa lapponica baueri]|uniref:Uncharacterized protein n=1 Tax=Limosa lapponica baueri TaxID=1758121 RepID=A0A2I0TAJ7_LIMLA|nr:hypothetical protein llap_18892 [Limosa lapponica baueri]
MLSEDQDCTWKKSSCKSRERKKEKETLHSRLLDLTLQVCRGMLLVDEPIVQLVNQHGVTRFSKLFIYKES